MENKNGNSPDYQRNHSPDSPLAPFQHPAFKVMWIATVVSNIGTWMNDVGASWLMTTLSQSPLQVALVQTATTLPIFLFAFPAGALADIVDRRRLLLWVQVLMALTALLMAIFVRQGWMTVSLLLLFTFLLGVGAAFNAPVWQAIVPSLVARRDLPAAIALNGAGINVSRAIGPVLAGLLIVAVGISMPFVINAVSFIAVIAALIWWKPLPGRTTSLPAEKLVSAMLAGLRYVRSSRPMKATLLRAAGFFVFVSAYWALLPIVARQELGGEAGLYGILMGAIGIGALLGALTLQPVKRLVGNLNRLVAISTVVVAVSFTLVALLPYKEVAIACSLLFGACWIFVLSSFHLSAQTALPDWARARGLAIFLTVFFGSLSLGSILWGQLASMTSVPTALVIAGVGALIAIPLTWHAKINQAEHMDMSPSMHWPQPLVQDETSLHGGPVLVIVEYNVVSNDRVGFLKAIEALAEQRQRNGAFGWQIYEDTGVPGRFVEHFLEHSWTEHLRHHERVTEADKSVQEKVNAYVKGPELPKVTHYRIPGRQPES